MLPSNAKIGTYYRTRSKQWAERRGYAVAVLEQLRWVFKPGIDPKTRQPYRPLAVKRDQLGADLFIVNLRHQALVQVKFGRSNIAQAIHDFRAIQVSPTLEKWIFVWEKGAHGPEVIDAKTYVIRGEEVDIPFDPKKQVGGLF